VGDDLVILDLDSSRYYALDPVGARIFELLQQPRALDAVLDAVVAEFEVETDTAQTDLLALVDTLVAERLVEARGASSAS
jgi:Skp family chaperone for outer membrane proteins